MSGWPTSAPTARRSPSSTGKPHSPKPPEPETTTDAGRRWTGSCRDSRRSSPNGLWSTSALRTASCRPPLRAVPCIAQRLLALEADVGGQLVRGDRPRAGGVPRAATGQPHPRGGDRMGIPHGTLHRLFVDRHRSLRQHSPGHPLCGAGSRQARKIPAGGTRSLRKTLPRGTCRHLSLRRRSARPPVRSAGASTCTARGWLPTNVSNAPAATRRNT